MLNAAQFSAAKSVATAKLIQAEVFDENKKVRTYPKFKEEAEKIAQTSNETWLRVEYESSRRQCIMSEEYRRMYEDRDLYPYWQYKGRMDDREREEHVEMEGKIFRIGDPEGDECFPPNDFNCRCETEAVDDSYLEENKLRPAGPDELKEFLNNNVDEQFQRSPAAGSLPNDGSYFEAMASANQGNAEMFGLPDPESNEKIDGLHATFAAKGVHQLAEQVDEWKNDYHVNKNGDVVFQNAKTFSNVRFTPKSLHAIQKHPRGFENIPDAVSNPDEIWNYWDDTKKQLNSVRNYIIFGSVSYVVQTVAGEITDAFAVNNRSLNKYRKGVIL
jgi:SPP1 gp7 family putative phage head morphogenesis protein